VPKPQAIHCLVGREKLRVSGPAEYNKRKGSYDTGDWGLGTGDWGSSPSVLLIFEQLMKYGLFSACTHTHKK
jgi:hypothetical protein